MRCPEILIILMMQINIKMQSSQLKLYYPCALAFTLRECMYLFIFSEDGFLSKNVSIPGTYYSNRIIKWFASERTFKDHQFQYFI